MAKASKRTLAKLRKQSENPELSLEEGLRIIEEAEALLDMPALEEDAGILQMRLARDLTERFPDAGRPPYLVGYYCLECGEIDEAIPYLEEAVRREPDNAQYREQLDSVIGDGE